MLNDDGPKLETAEQRAQRYWRNNKILTHINDEQNNISDDITSASTTPVNNYLEQLRQFKYDIKRIILQRPTEMLTQYLIAMQVQKNKLLREKLKRLEREANER